jgi:hypothetical protein
MFRFLKKHTQANSDHFDTVHSVCAYIMWSHDVYNDV